MIGSLRKVNSTSYKDSTCTYMAIKQNMKRLQIQYILTSESTGTTKILYIKLIY